MKLFRWLIVLWFVVYSALFTPLAYAASSGGWAFSAFDVATSVVTALKGGASASVAVPKSPIVSKIGKGILGGVIVGAAIPLAINQITGIALEAVDWVLDPVNNSVRWKSKSGAGGGIYLYKYTNGSVLGAYSSDIDAAREVCSRSSLPLVPGDLVLGANGILSFNCLYDGQPLSSLQLVRSFSDDIHEIPIPTIADKVYDNAKTDSNSRSVVNDAVKEYVNEGSADAALDAKADADATHNCGTGTTWNGSACVATPTDLPALDFSSILSAIKSLGELLSAVLDKILTAIKDLVNAIVEPIVKVINDALDWFKSDPEPQKDNKPDIDDTQPTKSAQDFDTDYLRFGGQCPASPSTSFSVGAVSVPLSIDLTPLCDFVVLVRPAILAMAYLSALFVVARAIGETQ